MLNWAQELGRAGRDGHQSSATIIYDLSHANPWVINILHDKDKCGCILFGFSESWRCINAHLARRRLLLDNFGEENTTPTATGICCDVCKRGI